MNPALMYHAQVVAIGMMVRSGHRLARSSSHSVAKCRDCGAKVQVTTRARLILSGSVIICPSAIRRGS
jgi:hypothetical protein